MSSTGAIVACHWPQSAKAISVRTTLIWSRPALMVAGASLDDPCPRVPACTGARACIAGDQPTATEIVSCPAETGEPDNDVLFLFPQELNEQTRCCDSAVAICVLSAIKPYCDRWIFSLTSSGKIKEIELVVAGCDLSVALEHTRRGASLGCARSRPAPSLEPFGSNPQRIDEPVLHEPWMVEQFDDRCFCVGGCHESG